MITHKVGNLLEAPEKVICHGVNCAGGFGSGVAGQIAKKWPEVKDMYLIKRKHLGWALGDVQAVFLTPENKVVFNLATQQSFGYDGKLYVDYIALYKCFTDMFHQCEELGLKEIALPSIGCGLAGGKWDIVESILEKCLGQRRIKIIHYTL